MSMEYVWLLLSGIPYTLAVTFGGLLIGAVLGFPLLLVRNSRFWVLRSLAILLIAFIRSVPPIIWIFLIFFSIGTGFFPISPLSAALVGFGLIAMANTAEIYRGGLVALHHGQREAAEALNMSRFYVLWDVVLPQMFRVCLPVIATYAIGLLKDAAVASTIGVPDLVYQGRYVTQMTFEGLSVMAAVGVLYILISLPIAWVSRLAETRLRRAVST